MEKNVPVGVSTLHTHTRLGKDLSPSAMHGHDTHVLHEGLSDDEK